MSDFRDVDEFGFPLHIDEMVRNKFSGMETFDYDREREENNRIAAIELEAILSAGIGESMYQERANQAIKWQEELEAQKERLRK